MNTHPHNTDLHVVLGSTGGAGSAIVRELLRQGKTVRGVSSRVVQPSIAGLESLQADITDPARLAAVTAGASVVYHAAQPAYTRWLEEFPAMNEAIIAGVAPSGARLVVVDNLYMYGPSAAPLLETSAEAATGKKGRVRSTLTQRLLEAHRAGILPVTNLRAADYFGAGVHNSLVGGAFFAAIQRGESATWFVDASQPHSLTFIDDLARAAVIVGQRDEALGQTWHVPNAPAVSAATFAQLIATEAESVAQPLTVLPAAVVTSSSDAMMVELSELLYQVQQPFISDGSSFARTFDFAPTPLREAVRRTLAWLTAQSSSDHGEPS
jgi:nucleoside-diphosphate-sugar epimerase